MTRSIRSTFGLLVAVSLALVACTAQATRPRRRGAAAITVATATSPTLGVYLTGAGGKTLYILTKDTANASTAPARAPRTGHR